MRKMKVGVMICGLCIFFFGRFVPFAQAEGMKLGVRLAAGINYLSVGDINKSLKGQNDYWNNFSKAYGLTLSGEFEKIQFGLDAQADLMIYLTPRFGISLGAGYILGKKNTGEVTMTSPSRNISETDENQISAIPVLVGLFYNLPISSRSRIFIQAGGGYYLAKYSQSGEFDETGSYNLSEDWTKNATSHSLGFHGGLGLEFDLARNVAFVIEGYGRYARISEFKGDWNYKNSFGYSEIGHGSLYYWEWCELPTVDMAEELPSSSDIKNGREARIDFSGFAVRAGIKIVF